MKDLSTARKQVIEACTGRYGPASGPRVAEYALKNASEFSIARGDSAQEHAAHLVSLAETVSGRHERPQAPAPDERNSVSEGVSLDEYDAIFGHGFTDAQEGPGRGADSTAGTINGFGQSTTSGPYGVEDFDKTFAATSQEG